MNIYHFWIVPVIRVINQDLTTSTVERVHQWLSSIGPLQVFSGTTHNITIGDFAELNPGFEIMNQVVWDLRIIPCKP
ncbi:MAG: hypothetical protein IPL46_23470 [Saprospiraceae bacterium]|nr:hypothetical protein [Saprospiraceae bacterium]